MKWDFFHDRMEGDRTSETQGHNSTEIKLSSIPCPPVGASGNSNSCRTPRSPFPSATGGDVESTPLITTFYSFKWKTGIFISGTTVYFLSGDGSKFFLLTWDSDPENNQSVSQSFRIIESSWVFKADLDSNLDSYLTSWVALDELLNLSYLSIFSSVRWDFRAQVWCKVNLLSTSSTFSVAYRMWGLSGPSYCKLLFCLFFWAI